MMKFPPQKPAKQHLPELGEVLREKLFTTRSFLALAGDYLLN